VWIVRTLKVRALAVRRGGARHLEAVRGTSYADVLIGNRANNLLDGGQGRDRLRGGRGRDTCVLGRDERDAHRSCERLRRTG
jgi:Ca2+-binding RTX toxin-like protein